MNIEEIKELIQLAHDSGVAELEVQRGEHRVRIKRAGTEREFLIPAAAPAASHAIAPTAISTPALAAKEDLFVVKAPIVGTFYGAASPELPPFVKPGDTVTTKSIICIIESMKLMNEIEAEVAGTVVEMLAQNGKPVEYGEALFTIRTA